MGRLEGSNCLFAQVPEHHSQSSLEHWGRGAYIYELGAAEN